MLVRFCWAIGTLAAASGLAAPAHAQSFNIDMDVMAFVPGYDPPSDSFGAAANQPGRWNSIVNRATRPLVDVTGAASNASIMTFGMASASGVHDAATSGDRARLLDDYFDLSFPGPVEMFIMGLQPGRYEVFTYAITPDTPTYQARISVSRATEPAAAVGGAMPATGFVEGVTHCRHRLDVADRHFIRILADETSPLAGAVLNGIQIKRVGPPCFADFDLDGLIELDDLFRYLAAWFGNEARGDVSGDDFVSIEDLFVYLSLYLVGC